MVNIREPWPIDHILEKSTKHGESKMKQREMRKFFISAFSDPFPKFVCGTAVGIPYFAHCVINSCCPKRYIAVSLYITMSKEIDCMSTFMSPLGHSDSWAVRITHSSSQTEYTQTVLPKKSGPKMGEYIFPCLNCKIIPSQPTKSNLFPSHLSGHLLRHS